MSEQNNTQVIGADVKRLPFKDLVKRIGPGLIATGIVIGPGARYHRRHAGLQLWLQPDVAGMAHYLHGYDLHDGHQPSGHCHRYAHHPRHPQVLWPRSLRHCVHCHVPGLPVLHHEQYFRHRCPA